MKQKQQPKVYHVAVQTIDGDALCGLVEAKCAVDAVAMALIAHFTQGIIPCGIATPKLAEKSKHGREILADPKRAALTYQMLGRMVQEFLGAAQVVPREPDFGKLAVN